MKREQRNLAVFYCQIASAINIMTSHTQAFISQHHARHQKPSRILNHPVGLGTGSRVPYHQILHVKRSPKVKKETKGFQKSDESIQDFQQGTMNTALCIVPPDDAWDDIQRARHLAKDPSFFTWPPAIRLFHPFVDKSSLTDVASALAELIEKYDLESFDITIDKLLILPHFEDLQQHEDDQKLLPKQAHTVHRVTNKDDERVQALIMSEAKKGRKKLEKRRAKEKMMENMGSEQDDDETDAQNDEDEYFESDVDDHEEDEERNIHTSPRKTLREQRKSMHEFNGPCVLYLEPNEESKIHIQAFREILRKKLFSNYDPFSPSSTVTSENILQMGLPRNVLRQHGLVNEQSTKSKPKRKTVGSTFRPVIPLGRFSTVTRAVDVAKKLQAVWEPLTFRVCDLHLVSKSDTSSTKMNENRDDMKSFNPYKIYVDENGVPTLPENKELNLRKFHGNDGTSTNNILNSKGEYGCDAMIMLQGEEHQLIQKQTTEINDNNADSTSHEEIKASVHLDEKDEAQIMELLMSPAAIAGGQHEPAGISPDTEADANTDELSLGSDNDVLQSLLGDDDDEDDDDGATIIIGRIQFFMGEMRQYTGMPASSTIDSKDRAIGDDNVSGSARRRGAVHRQGDRWQEGDFGRKERDYKP